MTQRVIVVLDDKLMSQLRNIQTKKIRESHHSVSFSKLLNDVFKVGLKKK